MLLVKRRAIIIIDINDIHTLKFTANLNNWKLTSINIYIPVEWRRAIACFMVYELES